MTPTLPEKNSIIDTRFPENRVSKLRREKMMNQMKEQSEISRTLEKYLPVLLNSITKK